MQLHKWSVYVYPFTIAILLFSDKSEF